jgi:hypothetical protein
MPNLTVNGRRIGRWKKENSRMSILIGLAYAAAIFVAFACVAFLVSELPKGGFVLADDDAPPPPDWMKARNVLMIPLAGYLFYRFARHEAALGQGPWPGLDIEQAFSFRAEIEAVNSVGRFLMFLWEGATTGMGLLASYIAVVSPLSGLAAAISIAVAVAIIGGLLYLMGQSLMVALTMGGAVLVAAPVVAHVVGLVIFMAMGAFWIFGGLLIIAFLLTGGTLFDRR